MAPALGHPRRDELARDISPTKVLATTFGIEDAREPLLELAPPILLNHASFLGVQDAGTP